MSKKNKQNKQRKPQKPAVAKQQVVTLTDIEDARTALIESDNILKSVPEDDVNVASIWDTYVTDGSVSPEDVTKCVEDLRKSIWILNATKQKYEELKSKLEEDKKVWGKVKSEEEQNIKVKRKKTDEEILKDKQRLVEKANELNERELKLIEDESATQIGDHSVVIERLIKAFKANKEKVIQAAETQMEEQAKVANEYIDKLEKVSAKESQLKIKEKELAILQKKVQIRASLIDEERNSMREELEQEAQDEYKDRLDRASKEIERYKGKLEKSNKEIEEIKNRFDIVQSAFGDMDPVEMAVFSNKLEEKIVDLQRELESRPTQDDLDAKQKEVNLLRGDLIELRAKFNENEYLELKKMFDNNDFLLRDKQLLEDKLESAKLRETALHETIDVLQRTISEINERHNKDNAFKTSSKYDAGGDYQLPMVNSSAPDNLSDFISYLQSFMASTKNGDKVLKYSKDTIKKFIAGLHMSPVSILQGISGTGKTSLPRAVAMAMTANDDRYNISNGDDELPKAPYRICPIQSGWRDKMDLMGFYNSFEKSYHETEFYNALYLANQPKYKDTLFFIVLDEMNLSRPEHYFADFLSKLEQPEEQRKIKIDNVPDDICPKSIIGGVLSIPKNVRFIGTANHDETTLEFAPKTYDRSNVIEMPRNCPTDNIPDFLKKYSITYGWLDNKFKEAENKHMKECEAFESFIKDKALLDLLSERGIGIGNRFEGQAKRFLSVFVEAGDNVAEDTAKAVDHLVTTRLFRILKDNYDLSPDTLDEFKERYKRLFYGRFKYEPTEAIELIKKELDKKR